MWKRRDEGIEIRDTSCILIRARKVGEKHMFRAFSALMTNNRKEIAILCVKGLRSYCHFI